MKSKKPFLEDEDGSSISRTAFRKMRKARKRELMLRWFGQNFEDPAENTSYITAEGGYMWNHGGPYDAKDELFGMFGDLVPEAWIDEVVTEVQDENGIYEWAGTSEHEREYEDYEDDERPPPPSPFGYFDARPTEMYGSEEDRAARERVLTSADELLKAIDGDKPVGLGHNNPPEAITADPVVEYIRTNTAELRFELQKLTPSIAVVKHVGSALYRAAGTSVKWVGGKLDRLVDKTIDSLGLLTAGGIFTAFHDQVASVLVAIFEWLKIVAHTVL